MSDDFDWNQDAPYAPLKERQPPVIVSEREHYGFLHAVGVCGATGRRDGPFDVEHIREISHLFRKDLPGMAAKPHFGWCVLILKDLHNRRHSSSGSYSFWDEIGWPIDDAVSGPLPTAMALLGFSAMGNIEGARNWLIECAARRAARIGVKG